MLLDMFRASLCSSSGGKLIYTVSGIVIIYKLPYRALTKSGIYQCTVWQLTECDDTRICIYTIFLLKMSTML